MANLRYPMPRFLEGVCTEQEYRKWLNRKARSLVKRDRGRGNPRAMISDYKVEIQRAVLDGGDRDAYTGELMDWTLIGQYDNKESKKHRREYKKKFALLPTVDHVGDGLGEPDFRICGWRTNDCKNDLTLDEFRDICSMVLAYKPESP